MYYRYSSIPLVPGQRKPPSSAVSQLIFPLPNPKKKSLFQKAHPFLTLDNRLAPPSGPDHIPSAPGHIPAAVGEGQQAVVAAGLALVAPDPHDGGAETDEDGEDGREVPGKRTGLAEGRRGG